MPCLSASSARSRGTACGSADVRVLHVDSARGWAGGQNQVRLLMRGLAAFDVEQLCICPSAAPLAERLAAEGLPVQPVRWRRPFAPGALLRLLSQASRFDVLHAHDTHALQLCLVVGLALGVPVVAARRVRFRTRPFTWNRANRIIAVSDAVQTYLENAGIRPDRIVRIYDGVDLDEVRALPGGEPTLRARLGLPAGTFLAGTVGTLLEYKHQERLAEAAALAPPAIHWVIIGEGPRRGLIEKRIRELGVSERVHLAGQLHDARAHLHELNAFVFPSIGEAFGSSLLDAMALGIPIVASDHAGPAEVLEPVHAETGNTLVEPEDAKAFAEAVKRFREDAEVRALAIDAQLIRVRDFAIEHTVRATVAVYARVLHA